MSKKVVTPKEKAADLSQIDQVLEFIKNKFDSENKGDDYYHIIVMGEYPRIVLNEVEKQYTSAGWLHVKCTTSSERGEKAGLTSLHLYRTEQAWLSTQPKK